MIKSRIIRACEDVLSEEKPKGICSRVLIHDNQDWIAIDMLNQCFESWPHFSGDYGFPISVDADEILIIEYLQAN